MPVENQNVPYGCISCGLFFLKFFVYNKPMNLIETFENPEKIIETIISKVFFYGEKVFKVYKCEKFFFGDFGSPEFRKDFYVEDFSQNKLMAPEIYLTLHTVKNNEEEDFYIEMKKFDDNNNLTNLLLQKRIDKNKIETIAKEMVLRLKKLTENKKEKYKDYFKNKLLDIHLADLESDRNLLYLIPSNIPKEITDKIINIAKKASLEDEYYLNYDSNNLSILIDNHSDNIVFLNDNVQFFDVLPPKESWRVGDLNFVICRLATDVAVLGSGELAEAVYASCEPMPDKIRHIYEIRSALIQAWCFYSVNKPEIAERYLKFAEGLSLHPSLGEDLTYSLA